MQFYFFTLYFFVYGFAGWCTEVGYAAAQHVYPSLKRFLLYNVS